MKVFEFLYQIKTLPEYIFNSLYLESSSNFNCIYKYLIKVGTNSAMRVEIFIALNEDESELDLLDKTIINHVEINPAK